MAPPEQLDFSDDDVANAYDDVLVPVIFRPWAERLVADHGPWTGQHVLDLATGTGIVARLIGREVGDAGHVTAVDVNAAMLAVARRRCSALSDHVTFRTSSAESLDVEADTVDAAVCQQGFPFFPDPAGAARELHRVLRAGGRVVITCWQDVERCPFFGAICAALEAVDEHATAELMRCPFQHDVDALREQLSAAGFTEVERRDDELPLGFASLEFAVSTVYATPIGPKLQSLPEPAQAAFRLALMNRLRALSEDGIGVGMLVTHVVTARK